MFDICYLVKCIELSYNKEGTNSRKSSAQFMQSVICVQFRSKNMRCEHKIVGAPFIRKHFQIVQNSRTKEVRSMSKKIKKMMSIFIAGSLIFGITGCSQKSSQENLSTTPPAEQPTLEADSATDPGLPADSTESITAEEEPLSVHHQLQVIADQAKKWYPSNEYYAVTDLDQNGRLEIIASTGSQGSGHFTYSKFYQVDETGTTLQKCKTDAKDGDSQNDIVDNLSTAYYDQKTGEYHYITGDFATAGAATGFYTDISAMTLKENRIKSKILAYHSQEIDRKKTTDTCRIITKSGKETEIDTSLFDRETIGDQAFSKCAKLSANISWFQFDLSLKKMTEQQLLAYLERSCQSFSLGYPLKQKKMDIYGYKVQIPQFISMEDSRKQMRLNRLIRDTVAEDLDKALYLSKDKKYNKENPFDLWSLSGQIKYAGQDRASILVEVEGTRKETAHSAEWAYTINLDLTKEVKLSQKDILPEKYRKTVEQLIMDNTCTVIRGNGNEYRKHRVKKYNKKLVDKEKDWENIQVYQTADSVGLLINTAFSAGSYAIFEVLTYNYQDSGIPLEQVNWEAYQYQMTAENYQTLEKYLPVLNGQASFVWTRQEDSTDSKKASPKNTSITMDKFQESLKERSGKDSDSDDFLLESISLCDLTGDGTMELVLYFPYKDGNYLILRREGEIYYGTDVTYYHLMDLQKNGVFIDCGDDARENYIYGTGSYFQMTFEKGVFGRKLLGVLEEKKGKLFIDGKRVDENTYEDWQEDMMTGGIKEYIPWEYNSIEA